MPVNPKATALTVGLIAALSAITIAQQQPSARPNDATQEPLLQVEGHVDWIEKSDVSALRPGVIERMEVWEGTPVVRDGTLGTLYQKTAELTVAKAQIAAESEAAEMEAQARKDLAAHKVARDRRLNQRNPGQVSQEEQQTHEAEFAVAHAQLAVAKENRELAKAELNLAEQALEEHTIKAPFDGVVIERMKHPGESVQAGEPVVRMASLDRLKIQVWVPIEYAFQVDLDQAVEVRPVIGRGLSIEQKTFRGRVAFVDPQIQPVAEEARRVIIEVGNPDHDLSPGMRAMVSFLDLKPEGTPPPAQAGRARAADSSIVPTARRTGGR